MDEFKINIQAYLSKNGEFTEVKNGNDLEMEDTENTN
jgi:hypothetical protein